jgi:polysaccharide biosynthesis transport protein
VALTLLFTSLAAIVAAIFGERLENRVREAQPLARFFHVDVLGSLTVVKCWSKRETAPDSGFEDAMRILRNSIRLGTVGQHMKSIMITSASSAEGKTTAGVYLAMAHAQRKFKTLLVDRICGDPECAAGWACRRKAVWP